MDSAEEFGDALQRLRSRRGVSQRALAKAVFVDHTVLSRLENGRHRPAREIAERLDEALEADGALLALVPAGLVAADRSALPASAPPASGLPSVAAHFVGREPDLAAVAAALLPVPGSAAPRICTIHGTAGSGKTALAVRAVRQVLESLPDGCLFLDLHGYTAGGTPLSPAEALGRLLGRLGRAASDLPDSVEERSALFRAATDRLALVLVLDNALSAAQVLPLLPTGPRCAVLVTSRNRLTALDDAEYLALGPLPSAAALELLRATARPADTPAADAACEEIAGYCGQLPLALRIAAARARRVSVEELAARLRDEYRRLAELDDGERSVTAALEVSYAALDPAQQELLALLGLYPDEPFDAETAAVLAGTGVPVARRLLEDLEDAGLLLRAAADRYQFHDLVGVHCRVLSRTRLARPRAAEALRSVLDHALRSCENADALVSPERHRFATVARAGGSAGRAFDDYAGALTWLEDDLAALTGLCGTALDADLPAHCWQLAYALRGVFFLGRHWDEWERTHRWALTAARRCRDRAAEAAVLNNAALQWSTRGRLDQAADLLDQAMRVAREAGERYAEDTARGHRAWLAHLRGEHEQALAQQREVLAFRRAGGSRRALAIGLRDAAAMEQAAGRPAVAQGLLTEALALFTAVGLRLDATMALNLLGETAAAAGDAEGSTTHFLQAMEGARKCGSAYERARAHHGLGLLAAARGRLIRARWHLALAEREFTVLRAWAEAARVTEDAAARTGAMGYSCSA